MKSKHMTNNLIPESMSIGIHSFSEKYWYKYSSLIAKNISIDAAIMFGALANLSEYHLSSKRRKAFILGEFWIQIQYDFIKSRIFLSDLRQKKATQELAKAKFLKVGHREGNRKWVLIDWDIVNKMMSQWYLEMNTTPLDEDSYE